MHKLLIALITAALLSPAVVQAEETITTLFNVIKSSQTERLLALSTSDGRVYKTEISDEMKEKLESLLNTPVKITWEERIGLPTEYQAQPKERIITKIEKIEANYVIENAIDINQFEAHPLRQFAPTELASIDEVKKLFNALNPGDRSRSQCFKRAHIWAYDMWSNYGVNSQKIFIFYTKRYIQLEKFEWWFHVAPMVTVTQIGEEAQEIVMDKTFFGGPVPLATWKNKFMNQAITCPVIEKFSEYNDNQWTKLCYLIKAPMHYFRPSDLRNLDTNGTEKTAWKLMELQDARRAFEGWEEIYKALDTGKRTVTH